MANVGAGSIPEPINADLASGSKTSGGGEDPARFVFSREELHKLIAQEVALAVKPLVDANGGAQSASREDDLGALRGTIEKLVAILGDIDARLDSAESVIDMQSDLIETLARQGM